MLTIACMRHTVQACEVTRQHALGGTVGTISGVTFSNDKQGHDPALHTSDTGSHARDETCPCYGIRKNNKYRSYQMEECGQIRDSKNDRHQRPSPLVSLVFLACERGFRQHG